MSADTWLSQNAICVLRPAFFFCPAARVPGRIAPAGDAPTRGIRPVSVFGPFPMDGGRGFPFSFKHPKIPMPRTGEGAPPVRPWRSIRISNAEYIGTVGAMTLTSAGKGSVFFVVGCVYVWNRRILQL